MTHCQDQRENPNERTAVRFNIIARTTLGSNHKVDCLLLSKLDKRSMILLQKDIFRKVIRKV